ncbi:MAG: hypothetical protein RMN52_13005 [Anaerolineae bacterium]|nr:hypothetical protein [Candidatus Roseilinea sp.]MDW8450910.1 hypothetical protein [Anaerolineae bacterium]
MSKKSRRERRPNLPPEAFNVPERAPAPAMPDAKAEPAKTSATVTSRAPASPAVPTTANLRREYGEVLDDLRLTSLIFLALIAVMVVLSFIIR